MQNIQKEISNGLQKALESFRVEDIEKNAELSDSITNIIDSTISKYEIAYSSLGKGAFVGGSPKMTEKRTQFIRELVTNISPTPDSYIEKLVTIGQNVLLKDSLSTSRTGIIIAGFGEEEKFPTLVSYEIDGMIFGKLKFQKTNVIDIDRNSNRARVLPFAQKEMVERFLYGIDADIEDSIKAFVRLTIPAIKNGILEKLVINESDRNLLNSDATSAEEVFLSNLSKKAFAGIRNRSRLAIEAMVEFMPKPELVNMAEALVNLTSIKRKVSRGMETVGGPIDVAIISRNDGFVWVKRKHYFTSELNPRYSSRVHYEGEQIKRTNNGQK